MGSARAGQGAGLGPPGRPGRPVHRYAGRPGAGRSSGPLWPAAADAPGYPQTMGTPELRQALVGVRVPPLRRRPPGVRGAADHRLQGTGGLAAHPARAGRRRHRRHPVRLLPHLRGRGPAGRRHGRPGRLAEALGPTVRGATGLDQLARQPGRPGAVAGPAARRGRLGPVPRGRGGQRRVLSRAGLGRAAGVGPVGRRRRRRSSRCTRCRSAPTWPATGPGSWPATRRWSASCWPSASTPA